MKFYPEERVALFIDGSNLYNAARSLGFDIDYKKLLNLFASKSRLIRAFYYTALLDDQEYSPIRPLVDWLDYNGYTMVTKPTKEYTDASGRRKVKGNMDIELAIDMIEMADKLDHIVLFSGDGDFRRLVDAVQRLGRRVTVVSTVRSQPPMVADELRRQADVFVELQDIEKSIARDVPHRQVAYPRDDVLDDEDGRDDEDYEEDEEDYEDEEDSLSNVSTGWPSIRRGEIAPSVRDLFPFESDIAVWSRIGTMRQWHRSALSMHASWSLDLLRDWEAPTERGGLSPVTMPEIYSMPPYSVMASRPAPTRRTPPTVLCSSIAE